ncbi:MAG: PDZ domain-containing protein [Phycisphaeraceae bacterium]|nr:PDZ domain-containing protein [Phycisphaeraceae bacterium]
MSADRRWMTRSGLRAGLSAGLLLMMPADARAGIPDAASRSAQQAIRDLCRDGAREAALDRAAEIGDLHPLTAYDCAVAAAMIGRTDEAARHLRQAMVRGFRDMDRILAEPALAPVRAAAGFAALEADWRDGIERAFRTLEARWSGVLGADAILERDPARRILWVSALDRRAHDATRRMIEDLHDRLAREYFAGGLPDPVAIVIPAPVIAARLIDAGSRVAGRYEHASRTLVTRNTGPALRHEFVHAMHFGHMERLAQRQPHPLWFQEGLASLHEHAEIRRDGVVEFLPNDRDAHAGELARSGRLVPLRELAAMPAAHFMARANQLYPQARALFRFVAGHGRLGAWYRALVDGWWDDQSGLHALERAFDRPLAEIEPLLARWTARLRAPAEPVLRLGIAFDAEGTNDGLLVTRVTARSIADAAGVRVGDTVVMVGPLPIRCPVDLRRALTLAPRERLDLTVRRGGGYLLIPLPMARR